MEVGSAELAWPQLWKEGPGWKLPEFYFDKGGQIRFLGHDHDAIKLLW